MKKAPLQSFNFLFFALPLLLTGLFSACSTKTSDTPLLKTGTWRALLHTQGQQIPFLFEAVQQQDKTVLYLLNGAERILLDDVVQEQDSLKIRMHIFDAAIITAVRDGRMAGRFVKNDADAYYAIPFTAEHGQVNRFSENPAPASYDYKGTWEVMFTNREGKSTKAVGVFEQQDNQLTGTFMTQTGDYRYLAGEVSGDSLALSAFDGSHAYLFKATPTNAQTIQGEFYSGLTGYSTWTATRNEQASLANPDSLTYLKEGYETLSFTFPNLEGKQVSLSDPEFRNKVVVVQLLGSWCPNCMDETAYLAPFYKEHQAKGLEIIGLGFERSPEFDKAAARLQRMKDRYDITYDLLVAGTTEKGSAAAALPALNHVMSFPTTIIIGRDGKVRKIHTGFSGPGTGRYYEEWVAEFNKSISELLAEQE
ncbi:peroxiredoxin family protein [Botryobacter ruber]|uniref:peroxiredoxin family protein n=1 Tax=Botryobacter ruber TaxID=2171629 RepID=UPI000E0C14BD|nr:TlpA disulfide reductase family protein [Botryobacter ruber]